MIKAVIFDLDGLLIDTEPYWTIADNEILGREGFKLTPKLIIGRLGTGAVRTIELYRKTIPFKITTDEFRIARRERVFELMDERIPLMEGAKEFVGECADKGLQMAIATSGPHKQRMPKILEVLGSLEKISVIVTGEDIIHPKPDPEIFSVAAKKLSVDPGECLVVEDAPSGVEAAKAAGMIAYGVNRDEETRKALKNAGADKVFSSLLEIDVNTIT